MKVLSKQAIRIKICDQNKLKIEDALAQVNGKATAHTYTAYCQITDLSESAEEVLAKLLHKKDFSGAVYLDCSGGAVATCYSYARKATLVKLTRGSKDWFLTSIECQQIYSQGPAARFREKLILTPEQDKAAISLLRRRYEIASVPGPAKPAIALPTQASNDEFAKCVA